MRKLKLFIATLTLLVGGVTSVIAAATDYLTAGNGWEQITSASGITTDGTCVFVIACVDPNEMVVGIPAENSDAQLTYQTLSAQPDRTKVWFIENDTYGSGGYALKSPAHSGYYLYASSGAWDMLVTSATKNVAKTCYQFNFDGSGNLTIQTHSDVNSDNQDRYWGDWTPGYHSNGDKLAGNKQSADKITFKLFKKSLKTENADITFMIGNNSFETGNKTGWTDDSGTPNMDIQNNSDFNKDGDYYIEKYWETIALDLHQTTPTLPAGRYRITVRARANDGNTISLYAKAGSNDEVTQSVTSEDDYNVDVSQTSNGSIKLGIKGNHTTQKWVAADNFRLTYLGIDLTELKSAFNSKQTTATALLANSDYDNVTGSERTTLTTKKDVTPEETESALITANTELQEAIDAFIAAKTNYDALATARTAGATYTTAAWPRASAAKKTALDNALAATAPSNAADALSKANAIVTAYRQFVESNGLAEGVAVAVDYTSTYMAGADPDANTGWTPEIGTQNRSGEQYTKGDGTQGGKYYDAGWAAEAAVNLTITRELTLPAGQYQLQITARGSSYLTSYTMSIGGESVNLPRENGEVETGTFGHGWSDKYVVFNSDGTTPLTLTIAATSTESQQWISFNRLRLVKLDATLADATDYNNLNNAIAAVEAKLGFEDTEYAPWNNVAAMEKLAEAKAIDQDANNVQEDVQALTTYLNTTSNWTANSGNVEIVYNGNFSIGGWDITGWNRTNGWGAPLPLWNGHTATSETLTAAGASNGTAYYNQPGSMQYGNAGIYLMPLKANSIYTLTFKYASESTNSNNGITASVLNGGEGMATIDYEENNIMCTEANAFKTKTVKFVTGAAGNYVLTLANSGNTVITDVSIAKDASQVLEFADGSVPSYAPGTYPTVKITRTLAAGKWATAIYPFAISKSDDRNIAVLDSYDKSTGALGFTSADASTANVPFLMRSTAGTNEISLSNVTVAAASVSNSIANEASLIGTYTQTTVDAGDGVYNYVLSNNTIYKVGANAATVNPYRAYIQITQPAQARLTFTVNGETTAIEGMANDESQNGTLYNLQGQRVTNARKGIYIQNGKKTVIK